MCYDEFNHQEASQALNIRKWLKQSSEKELLCTLNLLLRLVN